MAISTIELCSGVGMLGEGLRAGLAHMGIETRTICHVEREAFAAAVLVSRMEEGSMDAAPIWSDICTFDASAWRGKVDCIVAGFPCQDLSVAGKRAGLDGQRSGLFFEVCRIATDSGAQIMFLENVAGIASATATVMDEAEGELEERAAARVVGELADLGWNAEWLHISASEVGASHIRERWFCLAWRVADAEGIGRGFRERKELSGGVEAERAGDYMGHPRLQHQQLQQREVRTEHSGAGAELADASIQRLEGGKFRTACNSDRRGAETHGSIEQLRGLFAPGPADQRWVGIINQCREFSPALKPGFRGVVDGVAFTMDESRAARLRCCGNGVVALQAAAAFIKLHEMMSLQYG